MDAFMAGRVKFPSAAAFDEARSAARKRVRHEHIGT